ncbi:MAG: MoaD/ThiS family protein [Bacteroidota bacterium]
MDYKIICFGIAKDILGKREVILSLPDNLTVAQFKQMIEERYPKLVGLASMKIAVNESYASSDQLIQPTDEIVLIPPVSGG